MMCKSGGRYIYPLTLKVSKKWGHTTTPQQQFQLISSIQSIFKILKNKQNLFFKHPHNLKDL